ncbi:unknown [Lachnospiraceae bacterium CAG:25]|nr:unknown [Lachnospiraceae bacterium CAG:25]
MTLRIFESFFYKSLIRACSFDNSLAASQNARSYVQTIDHRALRICKKRIQKVLMLSPWILINSSSYLLSDSYMTNTTTSNQDCIKTLFKSLHSVYVKWYWLISFRFVNRRSMEFVFRTSIFFYVFMNTRYISVIQLQFN